MNRALRRLRRERGQVLVIAALLLPVLLAMAGMAIDAGGYASDRRALQNAADAMALSGAQELPDSAAATAAALALADDHSINTGDVTVTVTGGTTTPAIRVTISRSHDFTFMPIVGINNRDVGATAKANLYSMGAGEGVVPWSITQDTINGTAPGSNVTIKYDASSTLYGSGNFGPIGVDGSGASDYESGVKFGATHQICSEAMTNCTTAGCPGTYPGTCAENSSQCDGPDCGPKTGNVVGSTRDGVDFRINNTSASCDTFDEVFTPVSASSDLTFQFEKQLAEYAGSSNSTGGRLFGPLAVQPTHTPRPTDTPMATATRTNTPAPPTNTPFNTSTPAPTHTPAPTNTPGATSTPTNTSTPTSGGSEEYTINPNCNPWSGGRCTSDTDNNCSRRVFLIPIIDQFGNGSSDPVTIKGFALVFLEGYDNGKCQGNSCEINARFVNAKIDTSGYVSPYDENSAVHVVRLTE